MTERIIHKFIHIYTNTKNIEYFYENKIHYIRIPSDSEFRVIKIYSPGHTEFVSEINPKLSLMDIIIQNDRSKYFLYLK